MKIKIIYDSDEPYSAKVLDAETGEMIEGIAEVNIQMLPERTLAAITLLNFSLELDNVESEIIDNESPAGLHRGSDSPDN